MLTIRARCDEGTALKAKAEGTLVHQVIGEMRSMGVPESFVFVTPDRYEEKNIDFAIQFMCKLRKTVQVTDPELLEPEMENKPHRPRSLPTRRATMDLVTNQSEGFCT